MSDLLRRLVAVGALTLTMMTMPLAQSGQAPAIETIQLAKLRADLYFVSSDAFRGRLTNTATNFLAVDWVRARFEWLGLQPGGQGGTFDHRYHLMTATIADGNDAVVSASGAKWKLGLNQDFYPHRFSASGDVSGALVFAGFGIVSPERNHDDYKNAVAGKIAVILDREPGVNDPASLFDGVVTSEVGQPLRKVLAAQQKGAVGEVRYAACELLS